VTGSPARAVVAERASKSRRIMARIGQHVPSIGRPDN
jgi:hypothetical protein